MKQKIFKSFLRNVYVAQNERRPKNKIIDPVTIIKTTEKTVGSVPS